VKRSLDVIKMQFCFKTDHSRWKILFNAFIQKCNFEHSIHITSGLHLNGTLILQPTFYVRVSESVAITFNFS